MDIFWYILYVAEGDREQIRNMKISKIKVNTRER